jgi:hypothetical protein
MILNFYSIPKDVTDRERKEKKTPEHALRATTSQPPPDHRRMPGPAGGYRQENEARIDPSVVSLLGIGNS